MTNKSMIGKSGGSEKGNREQAPTNLLNKTSRGTKSPTNDASPDSPQLKPELDEPRSGLQKPVGDRSREP